MAQRLGRFWLAGVGFLFGVATGLGAAPLYRFGLSQLYQDAYAEMVFRCDQAMREHFIAKARSAQTPSDFTSDALMQSEIALIDCHDYDLFQKKLLRLGLTEHDLGAMGLSAIEARATDVREIVKTHEIRY